MSKKKIKITSLAIGTAIGCFCLTAAVYFPVTHAFGKSETEVVNENLSSNSTADANTIEDDKVIHLSETVKIENSSDYSDTAKEKVDFTTVKEEIWHKMLNSIDYYDSVSGKMMYANGPDQEMYVEYSTNLEKSKAYTKIKEVNVSDCSAVVKNDVPMSSVVKDNNTFDIEVFTQESSMITLDNLDKVAINETDSVFTRENAEPIEDDKRVVVEEDGTPGYYYRCDVTNTYLANASLFPQERTFGFLTDFDLWDVDGIEKYVDRECYVISGETSDDYGNKIGVKKFQFYVDCETGVLLKYIGYDESENIYAYLITEKIKFGDDKAIIYKPSTTGYKFVD